MTRLALFVAILLVQGVLFEAGLRWHGGSEAAPVFQTLFEQDPRIGHRPRPGARIRYTTSEFTTDIAINAAGVRGEEIPPRGPRERRVLLLGDSIVLAVQVNLEHTFGEVLERDLDAREDGHTYRVINGGVQGYGPVEEWLFFDHVLAELRPDVVLVAVFVANDAIEALDSARKLDATSDTTARAREEATALARRLVRRSMVLQTLRLRYDAVKGRLQRTPVAQRPLQTYLAAPPADVGRGLDVARESLRRIRDRASGLGARTGLVLVPARFQVDGGDYGRLAAEVQAAGGELIRDAATERFAAAVTPLGLPVLDLLPALRSQPDPASLFFQENVHFTIRGHQVVGDALERFLRDSGLLD